MSAEDQMRQWPGEAMVVRYDRLTGSWIVIGIHSTVLGPAVGGTRMKPYPDLSAAILDAQRLAEGMTLKWAAAGFDAGGGKAVIATPPGLDAGERTGLLHRYAELLASMRGWFLTGPDSGTTSDDMDLIDQIAAGRTFCRSLAAGGSGDPAVFTSLGVFTAIEVVLEHALGSTSIEGRTIAVQGTGAVGGQLARRLLDAGASVVVSDTRVAALEEFAALDRVEVVEPHEIYAVPSDVFSPCALGGVLDTDSINRLQCRAVAGGANNQLATEADGGLLDERGILYSPDFVTNCGGAVAAFGIEIRGWSREQALQRVVETVDANLREVLALAGAEGITSTAAAHKIARQRLASAESQA